MCDYSLEALKSRDAKVGDRLVLSRFPHTSTQGFSCGDDWRCAVCLKPGTELAFDDRVRTHWAFDFFARWRKKKPMTAIFRKINVEEPFTHHDALELATGETRMLNELAVGQTATVLQLPAMILCPPNLEPAAWMMPTAYVYVPSFTSSSTSPNPIPAHAGIAAGQFRHS
jgi:hypothetical protein